jgi:hypothetical protein
MKRPGSLRRSSLPAGRSPLPRVNATRKAGNLLRAHGEPEFRAWIKGEPCVVCGRTPCDAAHLRNGGASRKADVTETVPMCSTLVALGYSGHHDEYDGRQRAGGRKAFAAKYPHLDLPALAAETRARWLAHCGVAA